MAELQPDLSVIVPVFNRGDIIRYTLESVRRASAGLAVETIVVDDGSAPPTAETLARLGWAPTKLIRQANQGLLFARLTGLAAATGRHVLFLDSDDLVTPDKFRGQIDAMTAAGAQVSYSDVGFCTLEGDYDTMAIIAAAPGADETESAPFFIGVQPPPHSPIFRTDYLREIVGSAFLPPSPAYNPVAEIWFYHNAAPRPARVVRVPGPLAIVGGHPGGRLTGQWERLAVASLAVMEAFARTCPVGADTLQARQLVGAKAFKSWRGLPRGFSPAYRERLLGVWRRLPKAGIGALGGKGFRTAARLLGAERAGRLFRIAQSRAYPNTLADGEFSTLLNSIPQP